MAGSEGTGRAAADGEVWVFYQGILPVLGNCALVKNDTPAKSAQWASGGGTWVVCPPEIYLRRTGCKWQGGDQRSSPESFLGFSSFWSVCEYVYVFEREGKT